MANKKNYTGNTIYKKIVIKESKFFNNGQLMLPFITDADNNSIMTWIGNWLERDYRFPEILRESGIRGISADDLNGQLRDNMSVINGLNAETCYLDGAFQFSGKKGFDFSIFDKEYNLYYLRNHYIGRPGILNGEDLMYKELFHVKKGSKKNPQSKKIRMHLDEYRNFLTKIRSDDYYGENVPIPKEKNLLTLVGEIQFGNWADAKHDLLKIRNVPVDYYIYISSTGSLTNELSASTVTFEKIVKNIENEPDLVTLPTWVIGLDIEANNNTSILANVLDKIYASFPQKPSNDMGLK